MKVFVFGAGAVGLGLASFLLKGGHRVHLVGKEKTVLALRKDGLKRRGIFGEALLAHRDQAPRLAFDAVGRGYPGSLAIACSFYIVK